MHEWHRPFSVWLTELWSDPLQVMMKDADEVPGLVSSKAGLKHAGALETSTYVPVLPEQQMLSP